jgi:hypothetical protein
MRNLEEVIQLCVLVENLYPQPVEAKVSEAELRGVDG